MPEKYEELILEVERGESIVRYSIPVTWSQIGKSDTALYYRSGQYTSSTNYESVTVSVSKTNVRLISVFDSGTDVTNGSELRVFYR